MKFLKMLGLAVIAATALMAFGAATASATVLCTATTTPFCTLEDAYPVLTKFDASLKAGESAALLTTGGSEIAKCTTSTIKGRTSNSTGEVIKVGIEELTWGGCNQTTDTLKKGELEILWIAETHNGAVYAKEIEWTLGVFGTSCTYGTGERTYLGNIASGSAPTLAINAVLPRTAGGFLCPSSGRWSALYEITEPHALYVIA